MINTHEHHWHTRRDAPSFCCRCIAEVEPCNLTVTTTNSPAAQPQGVEQEDVGKLLATIADGLRHAIRDHGPITKELIGSASKRVWSRLRGTKYDPFRITGETTVEAALKPHKAINFLVALEHQAHRNHEYHPGHCAECTMTEVIANKLREQLRLNVRAAVQTKAGSGEK